MKTDLGGVGDAAAFLAGLGYERWRGHHSPGGFGRAQGTLLGGPDASLYKSDKPGIAPVAA